MSFRGRWRYRVRWVPQNDGNKKKGGRENSEAIWGTDVLLSCITAQMIYGISSFVSVGRLFLVFRPDANPFSIFWWNITAGSWLPWLPFAGESSFLNVASFCFVQFYRLRKPFVCVVFVANNIYMWQVIVFCMVKVQVFVVRNFFGTTFSAFTTLSKASFFVLFW